MPNTPYFLGLFFAGDSDLNRSIFTFQPLKQEKTVGLWEKNKNLFIGVFPSYPNRVGYCILYCLLEYQISVPNRSNLMYLNYLVQCFPIIVTLRHLLNPNLPLLLLLSVNFHRIYSHFSLKYWNRQHLIVERVVRQCPRSSVFAPPRKS